jgi:hypothetical protein
MFFDRITDAADVALVEIVALLVRRDSGFLEHDIRCVTAKAVDVRQRDLDALVSGEVDACNTGHG